MSFKIKMSIVVLAFSGLGYILGLLVHSEFFHHVFNWLFGG